MKCPGWKDGLWGDVQVSKKRWIIDKKWRLNERNKKVLRRKQERHDEEASVLWPRQPLQYFISTVASAALLFGWLAG